MRRTIYSTLAGLIFLLAGAAHATAETPNEVIESACRRIVLDNRNAGKGLALWLSFNLAQTLCTCECAVLCVEDISDHRCVLERNVIG